MNRLVICLLGAALAAGGCAGASGGARSVRWTTLTVPGRVCLSAHSIQLHTVSYRRPRWVGGEALVPNPRGQPVAPGSGGRRYFHLTLAVGAIRYGRLTRSGPEDALVPFLCDNNGGTVAGQLLSSLGVYELQDGEPQLLGVITPREQPPDAPHVTLLGDAEITDGRIVVDEMWYGRYDADCCPSGRAVSTWAYTNGRLTPTGTRVTVRPRNPRESS